MAMSLSRPHAAEPYRQPGVTCSGTWISGTVKGGSPREVYLHHVMDNNW